MRDFLLKILLFRYFFLATVMLFATNFGLIFILENYDKLLGSAFILKYVSGKYI